MIEELLRPHIRDLVPYSTARDEFSGQARIYLDANENPFATDVNRYPDPHQKAIKTRLSALVGAGPETIFVGNGSDEAIDLLTRAVAAPGDSIAIMPPTYGMYKVAARTNDVRVLEAPLQADFSVDLVRVRDVARRGAKVLFVCSPNNPTGNQVPLDTIRKITEEFPGLVVVDEAYVDFARGASAIELIGEIDRVIVLRTLSKAWGLAGARLGYAVGAPLLVATLSKIKSPYNVGTLTQKYVLARFDELKVVKRQISIIVSEREKMRGQLETMPGIEKVFSSDANFLLVKMNNASKVFESLTQSGIIVRDRSKEAGCEGCLRITIGTEEENKEVLRLISEAL